MDKFTQLRNIFEQAKDAQQAKQMSAYMRNQFKYYGISAPVRKKLCKSLIRDEKKRKCVDWAFLDLCWNDEHREFQYVVTDYLSAMQQFLIYEDVAHIEKYIRTKQWWDVIDGLDRIVGNIAFVDSRIDNLMRKWSTDENFWVRRIAIDHQLLRKEKTNTELLETILVNNFGSTEFFINKAIGWSLRDYSKTNPAWVADFIARHHKSLSPLSIREASKYL